MYRMIFELSVKVQTSPFRDLSRYSSGLRVFGGEQVRDVLGEHPRLRRSLVARQRNRGMGVPDHLQVRRRAFDAAGVTANGTAVRQAIAESGSITARTGR